MGIDNHEEFPRNVWEKSLSFHVAQPGLALSRVKQMLGMFQEGEDDDDKENRHPKCKQTCSEGLSTDEGVGPDCWTQEEIKKLVHDINYCYDEIMATYLNR